MNIADLKQFCPGGRAAILQGIADHWPVVEEAGIETPHRICHFMAQIAHESAGLRAVEEYASGHAYEGRADLGNTESGDGVRFKGRGLIQVTGRSNVKAFTEWCEERYDAAPDFVAHPEQLAQFPWALISAVWYWQTRGLDRWADRNDIRSITKRINGGYNGLADRRALFRKAVALWGEGEVNAIGKSFLASRAVKAAGTGASALGISSLYDVSNAVQEGRGLAEAVGISFPVLVVVAVLLAVIGYLLWDRYFIAQHEGL